MPVVSLVLTFTVRMKIEEIAPIMMLKIPRYTSISTRVKAEVFEYLFMVFIIHSAHGNKKESTCRYSLFL
jgi:hypothetical protein